MQWILSCKLIDGWDNSILGLTRAQGAFQEKVHMNDNEIREKMERIKAVYDVERDQYVAFARRYIPCNITGPHRKFYHSGSLNQLINERPPHYTTNVGCGL